MGSRREGPSAPPSGNTQVSYHLNVVQAKRRGLTARKQMFKQKYEKYTNIFNATYIAKRLFEQPMCSHWNI